MRIERDPWRCLRAIGEGAGTPIDPDADPDSPEQGNTVCCINDTVESRAATPARPQCVWQQLTIPCYFLFPRHEVMRNMRH